MNCVQLTTQQNNICETHVSELEATQQNEEFADDGGFIVETEELESFIDGREVEILGEIMFRITIEGHGSTKFYVNRTGKVFCINGLFVGSCSKKEMSMISKVWDEYLEKKQWKLMQ